jgi:hypothetical protein
VKHFDRDLGVDIQSLLPQEMADSFHHLAHGPIRLSQVDCLPSLGKNEGPGQDSRGMADRMVRIIAAVLRDLKENAEVGGMIRALRRPPPSPRWAQSPSRYFARPEPLQQRL